MFVVVNFISWSCNIFTSLWIFEYRNWESNGYC